ncbi:MAG: poly-gamma-glutamate system protein [Lachnospiraceae bacterium]|nr:poly-gamma-glutamate system protein [Lachnospiraceae bacterium]
MTKRKQFGYALLLLALTAAALLIYLTGRRIRLPYADEMDAASRLHVQVVEAVKEERLARGYELVPEDRLKIGLLGEEITDITTSLGNLEAKRTSQLPDMAALFVRLLHEAGVQKGDTIGASFSASFPGADLALLCAVDVMGLKIIYSATIGASNFGATLPGYVLPEMIGTAVDAGLLSTIPQMVSLGGDEDRGKNMIGVLLEETEEIDAMTARLREEGFTLLEFDSFEADIAYRMEQMGDIAAFVNVGGNILGIGNNEASLSFGQGLLKPSQPALSAKSGLVEQYLALGVPTIHFLNLKQLCAEKGVPFDPVSVPEIGSSEVYYSHDYSKAAIAAAGLFTLGACVVIERKEKKRL